MPPFFVDQHGAHIKENLPLSASIYINTPNMPGWDEDYKSTLI